MNGYYSFTRNYLVCLIFWGPVSHRKATHIILISVRLSCVVDLTSLDLHAVSRVLLSSALVALLVYGYRLGHCSRSCVIRPLDDRSPFSPNIRRTLSPLLSLSHIYMLYIYT